VPQRCIADASSVPCSIGVRSALLEASLRLRSEEPVSSTSPDLDRPVAITAGWIVQGARSGAIVARWPLRPWAEPGWPCQRVLTKH
jgi:hypothetical protein